MAGSRDIVSFLEVSQAPSVITFGLVYVREERIRAVERVRSLVGRRDQTSGLLQDLFCLVVHAKRQVNFAERRIKIGNGGIELDRLRVVLQRTLLIVSPQQRRAKPVITLGVVGVLLDAILQRLLCLLIGVLVARFRN